MRRRLPTARAGHEPEPVTLRVHANRKTLDVPSLPALNHSQLAALKSVLSSPISLVQGPPGTGKTVTSAAVIYHIVQVRVPSAPPRLCLVSTFRRQLLLVPCAVRGFTRIVCTSVSATAAPEPGKMCARRVQGRARLAARACLVGAGESDGVRAARAVRTQACKRPGEPCLLVAAPSNVAVDQLAMKASQAGLKVRGGDSRGSKKGSWPWRWFMASKASQAGLRVRCVGAATTKWGR